MQLHYWHRHQSVLLLSNHQCVGTAECSAYLFHLASCMQERRDVMAHPMAKSAGGRFEMCT